MINMINLSFINPETYALVVLPILIFIARILDVSLGTIRIVFISKGFKYLAPVIGFFEILIWLLAIGQIMQNLNNIYYYIFYAAGFAAGNFVGMHIEEKLSIGTQIIRVITRREASKLLKTLKSAGYGVTSADAKGNRRQVKIVYVIVDRRDVQNVIRLIKRYNPSAFYTIEDVKFVSKKLLPYRKSWYKRYNLNFLKYRLKRK